MEPGCSKDKVFGAIATPVFGHPRGSSQTFKMKITLQFFGICWCSILNVLILMERKWRIYFLCREEHYLSEMNWYISVASKPSGLMSGSKILTNTLLNSGSSSFGTSILMASIQWDIALFQTSNVITSYGIKQKKRTKPETQKCSKLFVLTSLSELIL